MKYCYKTTQTHSLSIQYAICLQKIIDIIKENIERENINKVHNANIFTDEIAFNLDKIKDNSDDKDIKK